jgi:hypothetical protein
MVAGCDVTTSQREASNSRPRSRVTQSIRRRQCSIGFSRLPGASQAASTSSARATLNHNRPKLSSSDYCLPATAYCFYSSQRVLSHNRRSSPVTKRRQAARTPQRLRRQVLGVLGSGANRAAYGVGKTGSGALT